MYKICFIFLFIPFLFQSQNDGVWMNKNAGQWDSKILHKIDLVSGWMYLEQGRFVYHLTDVGNKYHKHDDHAETETTHKNHNEDDVVNWNVIQQTFIGSNTNVQTIDSKKSSFHLNYLLGNDKSKWKSDVYSHQEILYPNFYNNIDLKVETNEAMKYSFIVKPHVEPSLIKYQYIGADKVWVDGNGKLHVLSALGEITENTPVAWTTDKNGDKTKVKVSFVLTNNIISFKLGNYNANETLVIDPYLLFSTFTGSISDNWGYTATPDQSGNLYAGGIVLGPTYPLTVGAFQTAFAGGEGSLSMDIGLTKFNATGTTRLYSTFFGGSGNETPNSIVCNSANELCVMGITSSNNFPMGGGSYDNSFNGGSAISGSPTSGNELAFSGTDIFVCKFSASGSSLIGSTYMGGTSNDGFNSSSVLAFNYGDPFRGEIIVDPAGNIYVASTTASGNFPTTAGADQSFGGSLDAVVFKLSPNLSTLVWGTYFGGSNDETGNAIQINSAGVPYFVGGTTSSGGLGFGAGHTPAYSGAGDGYIVKLDPINGSFTTGSYIGTNEFDQAYFVQIDLNNDVYVLGQNEAPMPLTAGTYFNINAGQFIRKFNPALNTMIFNTTIGAGNGHASLSPTAFLVSNCSDIYVAGWGGTVNFQNSQAINSTTTGFPVTLDAYQSTTNGSNFWVAVFSPNAVTLDYATFMGGAASSFNHVDGGTSRFDKQGKIYHAVCAACGGNNTGFTTTPGVVSPQNLSSNCNLAAWKFELNSIEAVVGVPDPIICIPDVVVFDNNSSNGNAFFWDFGDGTTSTLINPTHLYTTPNTYTVTLIVSDTNNCYSPDTTVFVVNIAEFQGGIVTPPSPVCPGIPYTLEAFGGTNYVWTPAPFLNNALIASPTATVQNTTTFSVAISNQCGLDTVEVILEVYDLNTSIRSDTSVCITNNTVPLFASGAVSYSWSPITTLDNPLVANTLAHPLTTTEYICTMTTLEGCIVKDTTKISVYFTPPIPVLPDELNLCYGLPISITASGAESYLWLPNYALNRNDSSVVISNALVDTSYIVNFTNSCGTTIDSVFIDVHVPVINAGNDSIICPGQGAFVWANGGISYTWSPSSSVTNPVGANTTVFPPAPTIYTVTGIDQFGCIDTANVFIDLFPLPFVYTSPDQFPFLGDNLLLTANGSSFGSYTWSPTDFLSCVNCQNTSCQPNQNITYTVSFMDINGCIAKDQVSISYDGIIYVPNTFTPDGIGVNNLFFAKGGNIKTFSMYIFDRWGELIWEANDFDDKWDGTYNGVMCQDGTYIWKIKFTDFSDKEVQLNGHVNLIR